MRNGKGKHCKEKSLVKAERERERDSCMQGVGRGGGQNMQGQAAGRRGEGRRKGRDRPCIWPKQNIILTVHVNKKKNYLHSLLTRTIHSIPTPLMTTAVENGLFGYHQQQQCSFSISSSIHTCAILFNIFFYPEYTVGEQNILTSAYRWQFLATTTTTTTATAKIHTSAVNKIQTHTHTHRHNTGAPHPTLTHTPPVST